jgi:hypothetical protein
MYTRWMIAGIAALMLTAGPMAWAEDAAEMAEQVLDANQEAVITIVTVVGISFGDQDRERELEANATVIGEDGLSVLALTAVDPAQIYKAMGSGGEGPTSTVKTMKMIMNDGTEHEAEVVLRDSDLDLAFVRPTEPLEKQLPYVDLADAAELDVLDRIVVLGQLGKVSRRAHSVFIERIEAIVDKPRLFYIPPEHRGRSIMCSPVFALDGKFLGIGVMRAIRSGGGMGDGASVIIVPAADIAESAKQVPPYEDK